MPAIIAITMFAVAGNAGMESMQVKGIILFVTWLNYMLINIMVSIMLVIGLMGLESHDSTGSVALPVVPRDQFKAQLFLILGIETVSILLPLILSILSPFARDFVPLILANFAFLVALSLLVYILKIRAFGKMRHRYVVDLVNINKKLCF